MELDDVAEKARRNLMVVSTGILAVWALGIPLDGKLVGAVDLSAVEPWRAWLSATAVLIYFAARYRLAPATTKEWSGWSRRRRRIINKQLDQSLDRALSLVPESTKHEVILSWLDLRGHGGLDLGLQISAGPGRRGCFQYTWSRGQSSYDRELSEDIPSLPAGPLEGEYAFTRRFYLACQWRAFREAYKPSWELLELSFPWFLAFGAAVICVFKLGTSLVYYSFPFARQLLSA